eukprot:7611528-Alexandrium_andersonii.AAC.1
MASGRPPWGFLEAVLLAEPRGRRASPASAVRGGSRALSSRAPTTAATNGQLGSPRGPTGTPATSELSSVRAQSKLCEPEPAPVVAPRPPV